MERWRVTTVPERSTQRHAEAARSVRSIHARSPIPHAWASDSLTDGHRLGVLTRAWPGDVFAASGGRYERP